MNIRCLLLACSLFFLGIWTAFGAAPDFSSYRVLVFGDVHFDGREFHRTPAPTKNRKRERERNLKMWERRSPALCAAAGKRAAAEHACFAVQLGDLVQGDCDDAKLQQKMIRSGFAELRKYVPGIPLLPVKGNHDIRVLGNNKNNAAANAALLPLIARESGVRPAGNSCYAFMRGRDLYIALDGFIDRKKLENFVRRTLGKHPDTRYVFVMIHIPLMPASPRTIPACGKLASMLMRRNALILAAHTHAPSLTVWKTAEGTLTQLVVSSMGNAWRPKLLPGRIGSWKALVAAAEKDSADPQARKDAKQGGKWAASGDMSFRYLFRNSGFVVLDIDEERVEARYYINGSDRPGVTLQLLTNRRTDPPGRQR